jgi:hypothetical protein
VTPEEAVTHFANARPGRTIVDFVEVGLPCWRIVARCDVLDEKRISTIDETIMRSVVLGVDDPDELELMLGLGELTEDAIVGLVAQEWVRTTDDDRLCLSETGQAVLADAVEIVSREAVIPFDYDGLLRRLIFDDTLMEPRRARERGLREIPAHPGHAPDVAETRLCQQDIQRVLRTRGDGRDQASQLLSIRSFDHRDRQVLPAVALVFIPETGRGRCEIAFVVDGKLSTEHEVAFFNAGLMESLGLDRPLRNLARKSLPGTGPADLREVLNPVEATVRQEQRLVRSESLNPDSDEEAQDAAHAVGQKLRSLSPRTIQVDEHADLLQIAIIASSQRLLIAGGNLTAEHITQRLIEGIRRQLRKDLVARIIYQGIAKGQDRALQLLEKLSSDYPNLLLEQRPDIDECVLISDDRFVIIGAYPWLGQRGDIDRPLADHRSVLTNDRSRIDAEWKRLDGRDPRTAQSGNAPSRRARRSRHRGRR